jgi:peroxiredoxin Q/BCP
VLAVLSGCRSTGGGAPDPSASATTPAPLDTSWERDPGHLLAAPAPAPNFEGIAHTGMRVRLSAFLEKPVVVYFYASDRSQEGVSEARAFRDAWLQLIEKASMVIGISPDDRVTHRELATGEKLPFLLVADERNAIAKAFGIKVENGRYSPVTFVISKDGTIARVLEGVPGEGHAAAVQTALDALP